MVEIADTLQCLFSGSITEENGSYVIEIPRQEIDHGQLSTGEIYRICILSNKASSPQSTTDQTTSSPPTDQQGQKGPPVEKGERIDVTIETSGEQGDGIAKIDGGYVIIVPKGQPGEHLSVEIENAQENVAFGKIISGQQ